MKCIGLTAVATYACTTLLAVALGTIVAIALMPLATAMVDPGPAAATLTSAGDLPTTDGPANVLAIFIEMIPQGNLINPFLEGNLLQIISIAVAVDIATIAILNMTSGTTVEGARVVVTIAEYGMGLFLRLLSWTMILAVCHLWFYR